MRLLEQAEERERERSATVSATASKGDHLVKAELDRLRAALCVLSRQGLTDRLRQLSEGQTSEAEALAERHARQLEDAERRVRQLSTTPT